MCLLAVETPSKRRRDSCRAGGPKNPCKREAARSVRDMMNPRANCGHSLSEVNDNAGQDTRIRRVQEQEHEKKRASHSPYGGEQQVASPIINGTRELVVVLVEHRDEPCCYR